MINADKRIKVILSEKISVSMTSPISKRVYRIEKNDDSEAYVKVPFSDLEAIMVTYGGKKLYEKYLIIKDEDVLQDLNLPDKTQKNKDEILDALSQMDISKFKVFLAELSEDKYLELAQAAVDNKISDLNKIKEIKYITKYDILPSILDEDIKFEPNKEEETKDIKEEKISLDFNFDGLLKDELKEIAEKMDINVGNSKKATIIDKLVEKDEEEAVKLAKELF